MQAFRLTEEAKNEGFSGGSVKATDAGHMFNVGLALLDRTEQGTVLNHDKLIITDDDVFAEILASYPALERVSPDEIPEGAEPIQSPRQQYVTAPPTAPFTPQTNDVLPGKSIAQVLEERAATEVRAEHADDPGTEAQAIAAGEAVSGAGSGQGVESPGVDYDEIGHDE